jgi:hypothetical protein
MSKQNYSVSESQAVRLKTMLNKEDFFLCFFFGVFCYPDGGVRMLSLNLNNPRVI